MTLPAEHKIKPSTWLDLEEIRKIVGWMGDRHASGTPLAMSSTRLSLKDSRRLLEIIDAIDAERDHLTTAIIAALRWLDADQSPPERGSAVAAAILRRAMETRP